MLWITVALLCGVAVAYRVRTLQGRRPQLWWIAFTATLVSIVAGSGFLTAEEQVNRLLGVPNVAYLLSNLSFVVAAGSVQIYVHTLRREAPARPIIVMHAATATVVGAVIVVGWLAAPIHSQWYATFREVPVLPQAVAYEGLFHLYLGLVLANVAVGAAQQVKSTPQEDPGRRIGLMTNALSAGLDVIAHALYLARLVAQPRIGRRALKLAGAADVVTAIAMTGIACGTVAFLLVPEVAARLRARRLVAGLRPLWLRMCELHPEVALPKRPTSFTNPTVQAERMMIEISDGLRLTSVPTTPNDDPRLAVARALVQPTPQGDPAVTLLPTPTSRTDEEELALSLANVYNTLRTELVRAS